MIYKLPSAKRLTRHCCQDGRPVSHSNQLLNHIVDCQAFERPEALFAEYPISPTSFDQGFLKITYGKLANAINRIAWWLVDHLGQSQTHETLAFIGANDLTYPALILGAVKAGYKTLLLSPRNSTKAQSHLLRATKCKIFVVPKPCPPLVAAILQSLNEPFQVLTLPSVDELLEPRCEPFIYDVSVDEAKQEPLVVIHTSGSTGLPKPITWPQSFVPAYAKQLRLNPPEGFESTDRLYKGNRIFVVYPPFHAAYLCQVLVNAITNQTTVIFPLKGSIPSAHSLARTAKSNKIDTALVVPLIVEEMSRSPALLEDIASRIDYLVYAGGDVPQGCGDIVAARMPLINWYGSTEGASLALIHPYGMIPRKDWKYLFFHPDAGTEFSHYADNVYELCITRHPDLELHQQIFQTFPELEKFRTRDLFKRHPTISSLWSHCGRSDDTIVFITGEKVTPVDMEQQIFSENPEISGVLIVGSQRFQPALLVELIHKEEIQEMSKSNLVDRFWPSIAHANKSLPSHAQIAKSHVLFTEPSRPMSRAPKGTIQRAATLKEYQNDLDLFYVQREELEDGSVESSKSMRDLADTKALSRRLQCLVLKITGLNLNDNDNMFLHGMNSLQALVLCRELRIQFPSIQKTLDVSVLYACPTIRSLLVTLQEMESAEVTTHAKMDGTSSDEISLALSHYKKLIDEMPTPKETSSSFPNGSSVWLLTGSTGSAGSYLLESLLEGDAGHIYCLNRSHDSSTRQREGNRLKGLSTDLCKDKVTFLAGDLSLPLLGLSPQVYMDLSRSVTHIIHNAWSVNFNVPLSFYAAQLDGVLNLTRFCSTASRHPSLVYMSSISALARLPPGETAPEAIVDDPSVPMSNGYGVSKYISEHIIDHAARRLNLKAVIARVGQIAGPNTRPGHWHVWEWFPSLIRSSLHIGAIPSLCDSMLNRVDWIPVDTLADIIIELARYHDSQENQGTKVYNVVNPQVTSWKSGLVSQVSDRLMAMAKSERSDGIDAKKTIETVPLNDWIERVRRDYTAQEQRGSASGQQRDQKLEMEEMVALNPAVKILDFYQSTCGHPERHWETCEARKASPTLDALGSIHIDLIEKWMSGWIN